MSGLKQRIARIVAHAHITDAKSWQDRQSRSEPLPNPLCRPQGNGSFVNINTVAKSPKSTMRPRRSSTWIWLRDVQT
jgi:hypothetical protein